VIAWDPSRLSRVRLSDLAVRFGFGAAESVAAAVTGNVFGEFVGGMFLAFPAILPATLTLLEQHDGTPAAVHDQRGALLGALGMVAFAMTAALGFDRLAVGVVVALASAAWTLVAVGVYLAVTSWRRVHRPVPPSA
jgi:hypothetical protein